MDAPNSNLKPVWLKELQRRSWEPEILLSGIVLYGMFQVPGALDRFLFFFSNEIYNDINAMDTLVALLKVGVYWLIVGLILHLICRGLWIGMVGLSYSFPKGIKPGKLKFQPQYLAKVEAVPPLESIILKLEHLCSIIYSISFLLFMSLMGTYLFATVLIVLPMVIVALSVSVGFMVPSESLANTMNMYAQSVLLFGCLGVVDFLTMGYFRRFELFAKIYWPFYRLFCYLSLARYYRPTYFTLVTNLNRWGLFSFLLLFAFVSILSISSIQQGTPEEYFSRIEIWSDHHGTSAFEGYYQDKPSKIPSTQAQIPSDIIRGDVLRVFIPASISLQDSLKKFTKYDSIRAIEDESFETEEFYLDKIREFYNLTIADSTFKTKMYFQNVAATNQKGYLTYLNIGHLEAGLYDLKVEGPRGMYPEPFAMVPFYKSD